MPGVRVRCLAGRARGQRAAARHPGGTAGNDGYERRQAAPAQGQTRDSLLKATCRMVAVAPRGTLIARDPRRVGGFSPELAGRIHAFTSSQVPQKRQCI